MLIVKNLFWLFLGKGVQVLGLFILSGFIAQQLGVSSYGEFQYVLSVIAVFSSFSLMCGAEVLLPRIVADKSGNTVGLIYSGFLLRLGSALLAYLCIVLYSIMIGDPRLTSLTCGLGLIVFFGEPFAVFGVWFQAKTNSKPIVLVASFVTVLKLAVIFYVGTQKTLTVNLLAYFWFFEAVLLSVCYFGLYFLSVKKEGGALNFRLFKTKELVKSGLAYFPSLLMMSFFWKADRLLVQRMSSPHDSGIYMAAMQFFDVMLSVALMLSVSAAPILVYKHDNQKTIKQNTVQLVCIMFVIGLVVAIMGGFLAPYFVPLLFGSAFLDAVPVVQTALWVAVLVFVESGLNVYLLKRLGARFALMKWSIAICLAVPAEYFAILFWGAQAAQIGMVVGYLSASALGVYWLMNNKLKN